MWRVGPFEDVGARHQPEVPALPPALLLLLAHLRTHLPALVQSFRSVHTNRPHSGGGGRPLVREGGLISFEPRPSPSSKPFWGRAVDTHTATWNLIK
jgi:hypothetical protein